MKRPLQILILEDSTSDAELLQRFLLKEKSNCIFRLSMDKKEFLEGLEQFRPDIILSDHSLPQFNSSEALKITRERFPHLPFILVTGTVSEEYAATIIKEGADDYILKDRLHRLPAAIDTALTQRQVQKEIADYKYALDHAADVTITDQKGVIIYVNENFCRLSQYNPRELIGKDHRISNSGYHSPAFIKNIWTTIGKGKIWKGEFRNKAKDGSYYWVDTTIIPFLNEKGKPYQHMAIRYDITEKKRIEQQLAFSEKKYLNIFLKSPLPNWIYDCETLAFLDVNDAAILQYGYTREEFLNMTIKDIRTEDAKIELIKEINKIQDDPNLRHGTWIHRKKNGELITAEITTHPIEYNKRKARMVVVNDITEKLKAEEELRKSEENYRTILERLSDGFVALDKNWNYTYVNKAAGAIMNRETQQLVGKNIWTEFPEGIGLPFYTVYCRAMEEQQYIHFEEYYRPFDVWLENHIYPSEDGLSIFFRNITERKKAEQELLESQMRLKQAQQIAHLGNWEINFETQKSRWSDEAYRIYGLVPGDHNLSFEDWMLFVHPDDKDKVKQIMDQSFSALQDVSFHHRIIRKDGIVRQVYSESKFEFNKEGKPAGIYGITHDVTESREAEEEVRKSNERFKYAVKASSDIIWELNFEAKQYLLHEGKEKLFGSTVVIDWKLGTNGNYILEEDKKRVRKSFREAMLDKTRTLWDLEYRVYSADQKVLYIVNNAIFVRDEKGIAIRAIGAITDITEKKKLELELLDQQKKEQIKITATAMEAQEKERMAIGLELHDNVNQILVAANMMLMMTKNNPEKTMEMIATAQQYLQQAIGENRKIAHVFVAPDLDSESLANQLKRLVDNMLEVAGIETKIISTGLREKRLDGSRKINIYRIAQEQCINIIKYAKATAVRIELITTDYTFKMLIADNGVGRDDTKKNTGIGLRNINARLSLFHGESRITTAPGKGFMLEVSIPLKEETS